MDDARELLDDPPRELGWEPRARARQDRRHRHARNEGVGRAEVFAVFDDLDQPRYARMLDHRPIAQPLEDLGAVLVVVEQLRIDQRDEKAPPVALLARKPVAELRTLMERALEQVTAGPQHGADPPMSGRQAEGAQ